MGRLVVLEIEAVSDISVVNFTFCNYATFERENICVVSGFYTKFEFCGFIVIGPRGDEIGSQIFCAVLFYFFFPV